MTQRRPQSRGMCRACGYTGTKASMTRHQEQCPERHVVGVAGQDGYRLRISGADRPEYWLDVELPQSATLDDLDAFLRGIWLECCGHLSSFTIGPQDQYDDPFRPSRKRKQPTLAKLNLGAGDRFGYTYDFGSSTDLDLQVQASEAVTVQAGQPVRLLARNLPPALTCSRCSAPARWVHSWEYDEASGGPLLYCGQHGKGTRDEQLPVVNSPRMGVCGYEGGNDDAWPPAGDEVSASARKTSTGKTSTGKTSTGKTSAASSKPARASSTKSAPKKPAAAKGSRGRTDPDAVPMPMLRLQPDTTPADFQAFMEQVAAWRGEADEADEVMGFDAIAALPLDPDAVWVVVARVLPGVLPPEEGVPSVVLILDTVGGQILAAEVIADATPEDVQAVVLDTMYDGTDDSRPMRPGRLIVPDPELAALLGDTLDDLGVQVEQRDIDGIDEMLEQMREEIGASLAGQGAASQPRAFLGDVDDATVRALVQAAARFMAARPWQVFAPDRVLRASWTEPDGTPGQLYALVMGDLGETHGLALYPDWLTYARHLNNSFNPELTLLATGGLESVTMSSEPEVDPQDWARLRAAGLGARAKSGPALMRFGTGGTEPPRSPLRPVIAVLNAVSERAERKRSEVTSLKAESDGVLIRFPAGPRDDLGAAEQAGSVRVVIQNTGRSVSVQDIILTGPPDLLVSRAISAARRELEAQGTAGTHHHLPYSLEAPDVLIEDGGMFGDLRVRLWEGRPGAPSLTLAHLVRLGTMVDVLGAVVHATAQPDVVGDLRVELGPPTGTTGAPPRKPNLRLN